ncbi:Bug family tripartite tricarboxylate transporter substrate binding protein [Cupriavidus sp. DF5525]|uniref:Bug family tripartite tricarboxylate transporter substrate binding protein n=1 Tax=Cupriavidus sp. DF5525 TaxID=3160989 RepID=UPI00040142B8
MRARTKETTVRKIFQVFAASLALLALSPALQAQGYPQKPIRWIVPWPAGGGADIVARLMSTKLGEVLGQPVIVDNRAGAAGNIGAQVAAQSAPDGYTIVFAYSGTHAVNPHLYKKMSFKESDFVPVILLTSVPQVLVVNSTVSAKNVKELVAIAKARPGSINYASSGNGSINHLAGEMFARMADIQLLHVPYKGGGPASTALLAGEVNMIFGEPGTVIPLIKQGRVHALAVSSRKRATSLPDVPTIAEAGLPGYDVTSWNGVLAPAGTPAEIIIRLNQAFNRVLAMPEVRQAMLERGYEPVGGEPGQFGKHIQQELAKWGPIVKRIGLQID